MVSEWPMDSLIQEASEQIERLQWFQLVRGQFYKSFNTLGQIYKWGLKHDNSVLTWIYKYVYDIHPHQSTIDGFKRINVLLLI